MPTSIIVLNLAILAAVLTADLQGRRVTWLRVLRPIVLPLLIVPAFLAAPATSGAGLALELAGLAAGSLLGLAAATGITLQRDGDGSVVARAGAAYAMFWIAVVALRLGFAYGAQHVFALSLGRWMVENHISAAAFTDAFIAFSVSMVMARSVSVGVRWLGLNGTTVASAARQAA